MTVQLATIGQNVFTVMRTLILANLPTYSYDGTPFTYTFYSEYPKENPSFPCVVMNDSDIDSEMITMDGATGDYPIEFRLEFYAKEVHGMKAIAVGKDGLRDTFINNIPNFISNDNIVPQEDFWSDTGGSPFKDNNQLINMKTSIVRFKLG